MDYESMSKEALKKLAKEKNMKGYSTMTKPQLVELLKANENTASVLAAPQSAGVKEPKTGREEGRASDESQRERRAIQEAAEVRPNQSEQSRTLNQASRRGRLPGRKPVQRQVEASRPD